MNSLAESIDFDPVNKLKAANQEVFKIGLAPPPDLLPSEWAEQFVKVPAGNALVGLVRFDNAPYQVEPLNAMNDPNVRRVSLMFGAQTGKTFLFTCLIGYNIAQDPKSMMVMQPTQGDLKTWLQTKLNPLIEECETVKDRVAKPRGREGVNNESMKSYAGGFLMFAYSGSSNTMRGRSAPCIICDEVDGYETTPEGDPVNLLAQRAASFGDQAKLIMTSTPTIENASRIETAFNEGDQRYYQIPCPDCGVEQRLIFNSIKWEHKYDESGDKVHLPETAYYECEACQHHITDGEKRSSLRRGRWVAKKEFRGHASYHLSELYSPFRRWRDIVQSFLDKKASGDLQSFVNVSLAETYAEHGIGLDNSMLYQRRENYETDLPRNSSVVVASVDTQDSWLEVSIAAFGGPDGSECWLVDHFKLHGNPATPELWERLDQALSKTYLHETGVRLPIAGTCIDSGGHFTNEVYNFCKRNEVRNVWAIKGRAGAGMPIVNKGNRVGKQKALLYIVGVDTTKDLTAKRCTIEEHGAGFIHFPKSDAFDVDYFEGFASEEKRTKIVNGRKVHVWTPTRKRNEPWDCFQYLIAAVTILNPSFDACRRSIERKAEEIGITPEDIKRVQLEHDKSFTYLSEQLERRSELSRTQPRSKNQMIRRRRQSPFGQQQGGFARVWQS